MVKIVCDFCDFENSRDDRRKMYKLKIEEDTYDDDSGFDSYHVCEKCLLTMHHGQLYKCYDK